MVPAMAVMRNYYPRLTEYIWLKRRRFMFLRYVLLSAGGKIMFAVWVGDSVLYYWKAGLFLPLREIPERLDVWGQKSDWCASGSSKPVWGGQNRPGWVRFPHVPARKVIKRRNEK